MHSLTGFGVNLKADTWKGSEQRAAGAARTLKRLWS